MDYYKELVFKKIGWFLKECEYKFNSRFDCIF